MKVKEARDRAEKLRQEINIHRYNYHVLDKETMNPGVLDGLKRELFLLEQEFPEIVTLDSPTQRVAGKVAKNFPASQHLFPLLSLNDVFSEEKLEDWVKRIKKIKEAEYSYYCELKMDGLAINLSYQDGLFVKGATRGNGREGEEITANLKTIESLPLNLHLPSEKELEALSLPSDILQGRIEVRGEAIMPLKVLEFLNKEYKRKGLPLLANTRNGAAGSLRQLDPQVAASRRLDFYAYEIILVDKRDLLKTREQADQLASLLGFKIIKHNKLCQNLGEVISFWKNWEHQKNSLDYLIDGVVVKINDLSLWSLLGVVGKAPRYAVAFKFSAQQEVTKIKEVVWQVGRTGALTPIAVLDPVRVGGVTVSRATLHNFDEIERLDLRLGDTVIIERAGDVIPKIVKVITKLRQGKELKIKVPEKCPQCGGVVSRKAEEAIFRCLAKNCFASQRRQFSHFVSKNALDIDGLGPKIVERLMTLGLLTSLPDLYCLQKDDLLVLERFAEKSVDNLLQAIASRKKISASRFLFALGLRHVGEKASEEVCRYLSAKKTFSPKDFFSWGKKKSFEDWSSLSDFGPALSQALVDFFNSPEKEKLMDNFSSLAIVLTAPEVNQGNLQNKTFVLTGTLPSLTRNEAKDKIKRAGGQVTESLSAKTDYLLVGENPGSKLEKAKKLGVKIIFQDELEKLL